MELLMMIMYSYMGGVCGTILGLTIAKVLKPEAFKYVFNEHIMFAGLVWPYYWYTVFFK